MILSYAENKDEYNELVRHPLQTWEWGEFRKETGVKVQRYIIEANDKKKAFCITFHPVPGSRWNIAYFPRGPELNSHELDLLKSDVHKRGTILVRMEPDSSRFYNPDSLVTYNSMFNKQDYLSLGLRPGRSRFSPFTFVINLSPSLEELLTACNKKTRYNIKLSERKGVIIRDNNTESGLETFLKLMKETTDRQGFYSHGKQYFTAMWKYLHTAGIMSIKEAVFDGKVITSWILFRWNEHFYYPFGASSWEHKEVMSNNLIMWKVISEGKKQGCSDFDMWGCLGPDASENDPWQGFHRFKKGYNPELVEFPGTWDLVVRPFIYHLFIFSENLRWKWLHYKKRNK